MECYIPWALLLGGCTSQIKGIKRNDFKYIYYFGSKDYDRFKQIFLVFWIRCIVSAHFLMSLLYLFPSINHNQYLFLLPISIPSINYLGIIETE